MNIYVGNLPYDATEDEIREVFGQYGDVSSVTLIKDRETNRPRGFGFVEMSNDGEAQKAIDELNGKDFKRRAMVVNQARPREERGGGGGGGFGGQRSWGGGGGGDRGGSRGGGGDRGGSRGGGSRGGGDRRGGGSDRGGSRGGW